MAQDIGKLSDEAAVGFVDANKAGGFGLHEKVQSIDRRNASKNEKSPAATRDSDGGDGGVIRHNIVPT